MGDRNIITRVIFVIFAVLWSGELLADDIYVRNETLGIVGEGLTHIKRVVRPHERRVIEKINITIPISPAPVRVRAINGNGGREIEISTGYSAVTRMIVSGYLIENIYGKKNFGEKYARYTASTYATGRFGGGLPPWDKAKLSSTEKARLLDSIEFNSQQHGTHMLSLWFVLGHEIAHHVLNHLHEKKILLQ